MSEPGSDGDGGHPPTRGRSREGDDDEATGFAFSRRGLLQAGASLGLVSGLTGCMGLNDVTSYRFSAIPAILADDRGDPTYALTRRAQKTVKRSRTILGVEVDVELRNEFALYTGDQDSLGVLSTPTATVATEPRNPLATEPLRDILVGPTGDRVLAALDLTDQSNVQWTEGPRTVATGRGNLLGQSTEIKAFAGVSPEFGFVLLTVARVTHSDDAVLAATVQNREGSASRLVGTDGYVTQQTITESVQRLKAVLPRIERGGAGIELIESARITSNGPEPNYIRVLASNQYANRTLFSVAMTAQLFDDAGTFLDHQTARLSRLGPNERFEGYLPYDTDSVAGYAVDADHSKREITVESTDSVTVQRHSRDGDTATVQLANALNQRIPFVSLEVTFYDGDGAVLATSQRTVTDLSVGEQREVDVVYMPPAFESPASITDYSVDVVEYAGTLRYVR